MLLRLKKLTLSLCVLGFSASIFAQPVLIKSEHNIEEYKLENGFRVLLAPNDKESKVFMNIVYLTGSLNDPKGKGGLAHLLEHLAFKGTQDVKGEEFQRRLDQYTLMTNAINHPDALGMRLFADAAMAVFGENVPDTVTF